MSNFLDQQTKTVSRESFSNIVAEMGDCNGMINMPMLARVALLVMHEVNQRFSREKRISYRKVQDAVFQELGFSDPLQELLGIILDSSGGNDVHCWAVCLLADQKVYFRMFPSRTDAALDDDWQAHINELTLRLIKGEKLTVADVNDKYYRKMTEENKRYRRKGIIPADAPDDPDEYIEWVDRQREPKIEITAKAE